MDAFNEQQPIEFECVLETDPETNDPVIEVSMLIVINMKPHQSKNQFIILDYHYIIIYIVDGVRFLWNQVFESTSQIAANIDPYTLVDRGGSGAILAHCMGLGKTFTTIVLLHTLFRYSQLTHIHRVLILCPLNTAIKYD
jgi:transcriptional regulator ATRX